MKVCPSTVGHVYIRPESDAYIGLQMQITPESTPGRYAVTFTAFPRRMGLELDASGLRRLMTEEGVTIVMVSHDVEFCAEYADSVSMFFDGQLLTTNTPRRFFAQNSFYTTAANRMSRHLFPQAVTAEDVVTLMKENQLT